MLIAFCLSTTLLSACGESEPPDTSSDPSGAESSPGDASSRSVPEEVSEKLRSLGHEIKDREWTDERDTKEVVEAFAQEYDPRQYKEAPQAFAVDVVRSPEAALLNAAYIVYVPDVPQDASGPIRSDGSKPSPDTILTTMVAFFDSELRFLQTTYIG
jgi:hypothetical protein